MYNQKGFNIRDEINKLPPIRKEWIYIGFLCVLAIWVLSSGFFTVDADEVGIVQRFGKYVRSAEPGLHLKIPFGVETVEKPKVQRVFKSEFGFRTEKAGVHTQYSLIDYSNESLMLTGDLNTADVEWIVQYKINDPVKYLFNVRNVTETLSDVSEAVMRQVVGDRSVDEVIVLSRQEIETEAQRLTQELLDYYGTGLDIITIKLQDVNPPKPVQAAFNEVNEARQEKERIINEALEAYNKVIPQAKGQAEQVIRQAEGYATNRINRAKGDAERFLDVWHEYNKAKDVTRRRLYLETMLEIMPKFENIYIVDEEQKGFLPLLELSKKGVSK